MNSMALRPSFLSSCFCLCRWNCSQLEWVQWDPCCRCHDKCWRLSRCGFYTEARCSDKWKSAGGILFENSLILLNRLSAGPHLVMHFYFYFYFCEYIYESQIPWCAILCQLILILFLVVVVVFVYVYVWKCTVLGGILII